MIERSAHYIVATINRLIIAPRPTAISLNYCEEIEIVVTDSLRKTDRAGLYH